MTPARWAAGIAMLVTATALPLGQEPALERAAAAAARAELTELAWLAGLAREDRSEAIEVELRFDGEAWGRDVIAEAIADDAVFRIGHGPHALVAQFLDAGNALAVQIGLERRGWSVRPPQPTRRRVMPIAAAVAAALGLWAWLRRRSAALGWWSAAVVVQAIAAAWPWPPGFPRPSVADDVWHGPVLAAARSLAHDMRELEVAIAGGVIALCVVLVAFDHRRSRSRGLGPALRGLAAVVGALVYIEGAARVGLAPWAVTSAGMIGVVASAVAVALLVRARAEPAS